MRLDRAITLGLVHPLRKALGRVPSTTSPAAPSATHRQQSTVNSPPSTVHGLLSAPIPILMYHSITDAPEPGVSDYYKVNTSPAVFRQHMQYLADHSYQVIRLSQLVSALGSAVHRPRSAVHSPLSSEASCGGGTDAPSYRRTDAPTPDALARPANATDPSPLCSFAVKRPVVITFDDGLRNFYTQAFPVLQEFGFTATMFLPTGFIGDTPQPFRPAGSFRSTLNPHPSTAQDCLSWSEVSELHKSGIDFGSHTVTHPRLLDLSWKEIHSELSNSRSELEHRLQSTVTQFCYPYAFPSHNSQFTVRLREALGECGYTCCTTTEVGRVKRHEDPLRLKRLPVNCMDDGALLGAKLNGSYDWFNTPQSISKKIKTWLKPSATANRSASSEPGSPASDLSPPTTGR